ncbi:unnamed protein product [Zymoseptoria tritici ST99CH_1A5]|uniref:Myb-like domain-containing protein n=1 Tax=Zymoseptoria tritici ST99CH_1A5 TaxID=1276529 RepID=A0A1Y6L6N1_ZYMTR|nr:unnamed protein product [Zymoseptoria tritici ST99CH_1A5]
MVPFWLRPFVELVEDGTDRKQSSGTIRNPSPRSSGSLAGVTRIGKDGRLAMVKHRSRSTGLKSVKEDGAFTFNDIKKALNGEGKENGKKNEAEGKDANKEGIEGRIFTSAEDAKIIANKEVLKKSWQETANELGGTTKAEVMARYKEINKGSDGNDKKPDAKGDSDKKDSKKDGGKNNDEKKDDGQKNDHEGSKPFTSDEDTKIRKLMGEGLNAPKIAHEFGDRTKKDIGKRMGELKKQDAEDGGKKDGDGQKSADKPKDGAKPNNANSDDKKKDKQSKKEGGNPKAAAKAPSNAPSAHSEVKFTMNEWVTLQEDDEFTFRELQYLSALIGTHPDWSWLQIASRFADKMDRRVHPEDIREKFLQMAMAA